MTKALRPFIALVLALAGVAAAFVVHRELIAPVEEALRASPASARPLSFHAVAPADGEIRRIGSGEVTGIAFTPSATWIAGASGVGVAGEDGDGGLPTLRASALTSWRGEPVVALEAGGFFRRRGALFQEARTGWGTLHVRALVETDAGELLIGAREGLFRAAYGEPTLTRLDPRPVRAIALAAGRVLAGGEEGLRAVTGSAVTEVAGPEPWIESVGVVGDRLFAATPVGLVAGPIEGPLVPVAGSEDVSAGAATAEAFWGVTWPPSPMVQRISASGRHEERLAAPVLRVLVAGADVFADTEAGLFRRGPGGFVLVRQRPRGLPPGGAHLGALAAFQGRLVAGLFDGGLAVSEDAEGEGVWRPVAGSSTWAVNALLPAGGALFVASLRGAARFDGAELRPIDGPGAAFALLASDRGVAIGYAQGVSLPGSRLVSAFHGLPGNQVLALASGDELFVGTPTGLGALRGARVSWRVAAGEARLPHPWVTALLKDDDLLYVGTYGGGIARRIAGGPARTTPRDRSLDSARYEAFPETASLKINPGCLLRAGGRIVAGTDGQGLWGLAKDGSTFERLALHLPSPRVTALLATESALFVGTDEGLARIPLRGLR